MLSNSKGAMKVTFTDQLLERLLLLLLYYGILSVGNCAGVGSLLSQAYKPQCLLTTGLLFQSCTQV